MLWWIVSSLILALLLAPLLGHTELTIETLSDFALYGGETLGVRALPHVYHFSGAVNGTAVGTLPGVFNYEFRLPEDSASH